MYNDFDSTLGVKAPSNTMEGVFVLYASDESSIDSQITIVRLEDKDISCTISVKVSRDNDISSKLSIMYRGNEDIVSNLEVVGSSYLQSHLEVRPHNRMFGLFELLEPPRVRALIPPIEDVVTRSREDLMTINYGDMKRMMVGTDHITSEYFESFIRFDEIMNIMPDLLILEKANLRLYYSGDFTIGTNIELHLPNTRWLEYGVTHANKPQSVEFITDVYTVNEKEKYIEFDIKDVVLRWKDLDIYNYGLIIKSSDNHTTSFYTRESEKPPVLNVKYITNTVYSIGKSEIDSTMFIWGIGNSDLISTLEVHSDWDSKPLLSTLYVHRPEVPLEYEIELIIAVNVPNLTSKIIVAKSWRDEIVSSLSVREKSENIPPFKAYISVTKPDLNSIITIDPNISLESTLKVRKTIDNGIDNQLTSTISVNRPEISGYLLIKDKSYLDSVLIVKQNKEEPLFSFISVNRPEVNGIILIRAIDENDLESIIEVPYYEYLESTLAVTKNFINGFLNISKVWGDHEIESRIEVPHYEHVDSHIAVTRPDLIATLDVHAVENKESTLYVKHKEYLDSTITIKEINELHGTINILFKELKDSTLIVNKPEIVGYLYPRVYGEKNFDVLLYIKQKDVSDLNSYMIIGGSFGAYYFII